jgi:hypothetical protein
VRGLGFACNPVPAPRCRVRGDDKGALTDVAVGTLGLGGTNGGESGLGDTDGEEFGFVDLGSAEELDNLTCDQCSGQRCARA